MKKLLLFLCLFTFSISAQFNGFDGRFSHFSNFVPEQEQVAEYVYQSESLALFARMDVQPSEERKQLIDGLIVNFKNASLWELGAFWSGMDAFWMFAAHDQTAAPLNWIQDDFNCTEVNSPTFVTDEGYAGNGSTSYLNSNFNPSSDAMNFTQNDASAGVYVRTNVASNLQVDMGLAEFFGSQTLRINPRSTTDQIQALITNAFEANAAISSITNSQGLTCVTRLNSTTIRISKNGSALGDATKNSAAFNDETVNIGAGKDGSLVANPSTRQIAFAFIGRGLTDNEQATLFSLVETYLDAIGAGVVE